MTVLRSVNATASFTTPQAPFTLWLSGLAPAASYDVTVSESGGEHTVTVSPGTDLTADGAGLVTLTVD